MAGLNSVNSKAIWAIGLGIAGAIGVATFVKTDSGQPIVTALIEKIRGTADSEQSSKIDLMDKLTAKTKETVISAEKPTEKIAEKSTKEIAKIKPETTKPEMLKSKITQPKMEIAKVIKPNQVEQKGTNPEQSKLEKSVAKVEEFEKETTGKSQIRATLENLDAMPKMVPTIADENEMVDDTKKLTTAMKSNPPSIDLLRVARDGYVVMAGRAEPNSNVFAFNGSIIIGKTKSNPRGGYVFVFDDPLEVGEHELIVTAGIDRSNMIPSLTSGIVILPENKSNMIVLLSKPGEASKILQMPSSRFGPKAVDLKGSDKTDDNAKEAANLPIAINAVDVEEKRYYIAGAATPNSTVNIYIDNDFKGKAITGDEGAFLYYGRESITVGKHALRVDMLGPDNSTVIARAEVVLDHETKQDKAMALANKSTEKEAVDKSNGKIEKVEEKVKIQVNKVAEATVKKTGPVANASILSGSTGKKIADIGNAPARKMEEIKMTTDVSDASGTSVIKTIDGKKIIKSGSSVIIRRGDSLWKVSRRKFGLGSKYTVIYSANRDQVKNPDLIYPGQVLNIPEDVQTSQ